MKILFLCKRRPQGRDLLSCPYGRFFHLPHQLSKMGHDVHVAVMSHQALPNTTYEKHGITWHGSDIVRVGPIGYWTKLCALSTEFQPDWIIGCSDIYYGILATRLARRAKCRAAIDAYDNFESYLPWCRPLHQLWRRAVTTADLVTAAGPQLAMRLAAHRVGADVHVLPMAADPHFQPLSRDESARKIGLDPAQRFFGVVGSLDVRRGKNIFLEACRLLRRGGVTSTLVLSGRGQTRRENISGTLRIRPLSDAEVPLLINCLDVACVPGANNAFGNFSYPAKLYEAMACQVPIVAAATLPAQWILQEDSRFLVPVGNPAALAERIVSNLEIGRVVYPPKPTWQELTQRLDGWLRA